MGNKFRMSMEMKMKILTVEIIASVLLMPKKYFNEKNSKKKMSMEINIKILIIKTIQYYSKRITTNKLF